MTAQQLHVVLGASGGAGNAIARALHEAGLPVRGVNRRAGADLPADIEQTPADITSAPGAAAAVRGASVVYLAAQPPYHRWPQEFPAMVETVLGATADAGAKLVMVDNLYAYGPCPDPMSERTPQRATDRKGKVRAAIAERLLQAHAQGVLPVTIGRASDYFGPRADNSTVTALAIEPAVAGRTIRWTGALDRPHAVAYLPDIARAYVTLGTRAEADGRTWILPHAPAPTGREFLSLVNASLPEPVKTGELSTGMLRVAAPLHRMSREMLGIAYQWTAPYEVDDSNFREAFDPFGTTPLAEAIAATVAWYRQH